ncbi:Uncharacterised protein [Mycobacterium tuberculosis]|uniref:Uncharacterized protein n=1 Tax=Mycobacterium tuberculosis TaxID=1773 RepID=A0A654U1T3_MYCTX|nr:Uncharacterised protein [Mycobacterium tuberculosis]
MGNNRGAREADISHITGGRGELTGHLVLRRNQLPDT